MVAGRTLTRVLASGLVVAGTAGILAWLMQDEITWAEGTVVILCALVSLTVLVSIWKK